MTILKTAARETIFALKVEKLLVKDKIIVCFTAVLYVVAQRYYCGKEHYVTTKKRLCNRLRKSRLCVKQIRLPSIISHTFKTTKMNLQELSG